MPLITISPNDVGAAGFDCRIRADTPLVNYDDGQLNHRLSLGMSGGAITRNHLGLTISIPAGQITKTAQLKIYQYAVNGAIVEGAKLVVVDTARAADETKISWQNEDNDDPIVWDIGGGDLTEIECPFETSGDISWQTINIKIAADDAIANRDGKLWLVMMLVDETAPGSGTRLYRYARREDDNPWYIEIETMTAFSLQPDSTTGIDARYRSDSGAASQPDTTPMVVGFNGVSANFVGYAVFPLADITANSTIDSAIFTLNNQGSAGADQTFLVDIKAANADTITETSTKAQVEPLLGSPVDMSMLAAGNTAAADITAKIQHAIDQGWTHVCVTFTCTTGAVFSVDACESATEALRPKLSGAFTPPDPPVIASVMRSSIPRGQTRAFTITGTGFGAIEGSLVLDPEDGFALDSITSWADDVITFAATTTAIAALGPRDVMVITDSGLEDIAIGAITVTAPSTIRRKLFRLLGLR